MILCIMSYLVQLFVLIPYICCKDLFSRFEQQILFLEKLVEATDPTTDRRGVSFQNT